MCCFSVDCEAFPVSELITIHWFKQILIFLYSASLPSFWFFCMISLSSLSALCFLAHFTASLSTRSVSILLGRHLNGLLFAAHCILGLQMEIREGLVDISHCPSISRDLHSDELTEDCMKHRNEQIWPPFLIHVIQFL